MNVELIGIDKSFGFVHANDNIHLKIPSGTIQGILGENGAGKSTLMKVLSGFIQADRGRIILDGKDVVIHSPADANRHGIGMLHQDPLDFLPMRAIDNFLVGSGKVSLTIQKLWECVFPNRSDAIREFNLLQNQMNFSLDPNSYVDSLTVGERQQLEILRLLWVGAKVIILDEPTTGISSIQKTKLFAALKILVEHGKTVIFVSHKLEDVEQLCHQVAVFRKGQLVGEASPPYKTEQLVTMMFGKLVTLGTRETIETCPPVLELQGVSIEDYHLRITNVNLQVFGGEVIGLAGMEGSGQAAFLRTCGGLIRPVAGKIFMDKQDMTGRNFHAFRKRGVTYLPAARLEEGLLPGLTLTEHFLLAEEKRDMFINWVDAQKLTQQRIDQFNIRGTPPTKVEALSGGNQQRILLALLKSPLVLVLMEHPTRGLDVESTIHIWGLLKERCRQKTAIILISSDLEEILHYSDRILVFFAGQVSQPLDATSTTVDQLGQLIGGIGWEKKQSDD